MTPSNIFSWVVSNAITLAKQENLPLKSIEKGGVERVNRAHCTRDGRIHVKLYTSPDMLEATKIHQTARTICHELAHLKHFNHGPKFWQYQEHLCNEMSKLLKVKVIPARSIVK